MSTFEITKVCTYCWGTGKNPAFVPEGESQEQCPKCAGAGRIESGQVDDIETTFSNVLDKLDTIVVEQISQREDLTAALTQIWNKVKDL